MLDTKSNLLPITHGVPQGSVLGPLLFILYINDIINCSNLLYFILFADDPNLLYSDTNWHNLINTVNTELVKLSSRFKANKLSLNVTKTNFMIFGQKNIPITAKKISIDGVELPQVSDKISWRYCR